MNIFDRFLYTLNFVLKPTYWMKHVPLTTSLVASDYVYHLCNFSLIENYWDPLKIFIFIKKIFYIVL